MESIVQEKSEKREQEACDGQVTLLCIQSERQYTPSGQGVYCISVVEAFLRVDVASKRSHPSESHWRGTP